MFMIVCCQHGVFRIISDGNENIKTYATIEGAKQIIKRKKKSKFSTGAKWFITEYSDLSREI